MSAPSQSISAPLQPLTVEELEANIAITCGVYNVRPADEQSRVMAGVSAVRGGLLDLTLVAQNTDCITRDQACIKRDPNDYFFLLIQRRGEAIIRCDDEDCRLAPGDAVIIDATATSSFVYGGGYSEQLSVHIPRSEAIARFGRSLTVAQRLASDDPLMQALSAIAQKIVTRNLEAPHLCESMMSVLGSLMLECSDSLPVHADRAGLVLQAPLRHIDERYHDPALAPAALADRLNVSAHTLQRAFAQIDDRIGDRILATRLAHARSRILHARREGQRPAISDIALDCGFNDISYFHRKFRQHFGTTPAKLT